jgi:two-component system cell cycle sensor histidine kinase/response regulator CckA
MDNILLPLHVLVVEDNPNDAELMLRELRGVGFKPEWHRVDTEAEFSSSLDSKIDIILSDYNMPQFSGLRALELLNERGFGIPFILVSGTIGEEIAVSAMQSGAVDYLLKDRLTRLGPAVKHALEEKRLRDERELAEEELGRLHRQSELILNSAGDGIYGLDPSGNINFINPKAAELLGWTVAEILGKPAHATIHHTKSDGSKCPIESCPIHADVRAGVNQRMTNDVWWKRDGSSFWVDYVSAPIKDKQGRVDGCIVTFKDITEQFVAEARQKLQAEQYRLLFETNPNPMWVFDTKNLQILAVNQAAIKQYGYSREEFLKLTLKDLRPPEDSSALEKAPTLAGSRAHASGRFVQKKRDGALLSVDVYSGPIVWEGVAARIVTAIDVTERVHANERLLEQANMLNQARDAIIIRNFADQRVTFWNTGAERLYGWTAEAAIGRPIGELIVADSRDVETYTKILGSAGQFHGEVKQCTKDGKELIVEGRATLIADPDGIPQSVLLINTDITEHKKLEMQLLRAQRLESIGTLASGVAHDLNNILTPILVCAETLRGEITDEDRESALALIEESAERGANVVKQVLTFARGVEGERVSIKPSHLVHEMSDIAKTTFPKSIEITSRYPDDLWTIKGDPTQLHQVLLNISVNARDAMPAGGKLAFVSENFTVDEQYAAMTPGAVPGPHVLFRISDTGSGMPEEMIEKIFDPFFTTKELGKGTGLGLSTVVGIVKSHGGFISVQSEVGKGTAFKIFLPADLSGPSALSSKQRVAPDEGNGELVLVVDDEPNILRATKTILERHNYRVISAGDGVEAVALFTQQMQTIRVVLTDISMPHMDGVATVRALRKMKPDVPIIACTGDAQRARLEEFRAMKVNNFLIKPFNAANLLATVHTSVGACNGVETEVKTIACMDQSGAKQFR